MSIGIVLKRVFTNDDRFFPQHPVLHDERASKPELIGRGPLLQAWRLGLLDRGVLLSGAFADVTVFNPETVTDRSTFEDRLQIPERIAHVFVNGVGDIHGGRETGSLAGRALRREVGTLGTRR